MIQRGRGIFNRSTAYHLLNDLGTYTKYGLGVYNPDNYEDNSEYRDEWELALVFHMTDSFPSCQDDRYQNRDFIHDEGRNQGDGSGDDKKGGRK